VGRISDLISTLDSKKLILILSIVIIISYVNSLGVYFIWDDYPSVVSNPRIRSLDLKNIFEPLYPEDNPSIAKVPAYSRPLQIASYMVDYKIWKLNPFGYHVTNIILHVLNSILLYFLLALLLRDRIFAFMGSALFGTNPIFTSSVTYISGRADMLLLFFVILMIVFFIKSVEHKKLKIIYYILSFICFLGALLSREIGAMSILFLIIIYRWINKGIVTKTKILLYTPFVVILFLWYYLKPSAAPGYHFIWPKLLGNIFVLPTLWKGLSIYTFLSVFPFHLHMGRSITVVNSIQDKWFLISILFIISIVYSSVRFRNQKLFIFGFVWFYVPLFSQLIFNYLFAKRGIEILLPEHNLYFCYFGFLVSLFSIAGSARIKKFVPIVCLLILASYVILTVNENFYWQDEIKFFEKNIRYNKNSAFNFVNYANLGFAYEREDELVKSEKSFILAAEKSGKNPYFYNMLASFYIRHKDFDIALKNLMFSKKLDSNFHNTYTLLGIVYINKGLIPEARENFEKAILVNPSDNMANKYLELLRDKFPE
jgi:hypothetical protein